MVCYHCFWELFGTPFPVFRSIPVSSIFNGSLAVQIFFVLSGFVLTRPGWRSPDKTVVLRQMVKRYLRLVPPVVALTFLIWAIMSLGLNQNGAAGLVVDRPHWLGKWLQFPPDFGEALRYATVGVFLGHNPHDYAPFLWVMPNELWGGLIVLGICGLERWLPLPYVTLAIGTALSFIYVPVLFCFLIGADLALLHADGHLHRWADSLPVNLAAVTATMAGLVWLVSGPHARYYSIVAAVIVALVISAPWLARGLESGVSQFLGRISYPLYLIQFPIIVVPTSAAVLWAYNAGMLTFPVAIAIATGSVVASIVAAVGFMPVERLTLMISRSAGQLIQPPAHGARKASAQVSSAGGNAPSPAP